MRLFRYNPPLYSLVTETDTLAKPAVFLDRDGVINVDHGYVHDEHDFEYIDGVFEATKALQDMGYLLVLVTNQWGLPVANSARIAFFL